MAKQLRFLLFAVAAAGLLASCNSESKAQKEAREALTNPDLVQAAQDPAFAQQTGEETAAPVGPTTTITFEATEHDFGTVQDGEKVSHVFNFKNTGNEPLILSNARGSCGCTVPDWPREPIPPGGSGNIRVDFDSKNKTGKRSQKVTITANTNPPQTFIYLNGEVVGGENSAQPALNVTQ